MKSLKALNVIKTNENKKDIYLGFSNFEKIKVY